MRYALLMRFIILATMAFSFIAHSETMRLTVSDGLVESGTKEGSLTKSAVGTELKDGDTVRTGKNSTAVISYASGTKLKMNAESKMIVHAEKGIDLVLGAVFAHVQKKPDQHFVVRTKSAVCGVRGTDFFTAYGSGDKHQDGWMCVKEGTVEVTPVEGGDRTVVEAGFGITFQPKKKIAPPKKFEWTENLNWNMDPASGDVRDKTSMDEMYNNLLRHNYD